MDVRPYLIVPKLIPQPTWGGQYIALFKNLDASLYQNQLIGQSYELSTDTLLSMAGQSSDTPIEIGDPKDGSSVDLIGDRVLTFSLQSLIDQDPEIILGKKALAQMGPNMQVLIKFTQAKGNSFQVHVVPGKEFGQWKPKPESWFYFKPGKATLGLKSSVNLTAYKNACHAIEEEARRLSALVQTGRYTVEHAKKELDDCVKEHNPFQYVNIVDIPADSIIDLSTGGIHHSWEEGEEIPLGNVVYEVQLNVMDHQCTLRSFDKGKMGDGGSVRPVYVDDYFHALDTNTSHNDPEALLQKIKRVEQDTMTSALLFESLYYKSELLEFSKDYFGEHTSPQKDESFHHLFVKEGKIVVSAGGQTVTVDKGASIFIPASTIQYSLETQSESVIIKTWV